MRLVHRERLQEFAARHRDSETPLSAWAQVVETGRFRHLVELRRTFGSADYVKPYVVFNIGGGKYRLIALINYEVGLVSVERVMTHVEYDQGKWRR